MKKNLLLTVFLFLVFMSGVIAKDTDIVNLSKDKRVEFGTEQLKAALENSGINVSVSTDPDTKGNYVIVAGTVEDLKGKAEYKDIISKVPEKAESFIIARLKKNRVAVVGRDGTGTLYGLLDIADQVYLSDDFSFDAIKEKEKAPYLKLRGVNPFLHSQAMLDTTSWYFSDDFWEDYLDRLVRTRHNFLDIHAAYDLKKTNMPNIFSFFFTDEAFPEIEIPVGRDNEHVVLSPDHAAKIFRRFQKVVEMAVKRGIKVGLMNYNTAVQVNGKKLEGDDLIGYTRRSVIKFLKGCPDLWMVGFRVGESGQSEDFFQKAYLEPIMETRPDINVYTRSWGADIEKIREMGKGLKGHLYVEAKYNGEQMGLPYPAMVSPIEDNLPTSYSYEDYTTKPQSYNIIWQIRTNGTHRIFRWSDPDFVRKTIKSCTIGDASGFTAEPLTAYNPLYDFLHAKDNPHYGSVKWMPQRNWMWYEVWGRLSYDPEIGDTFFQRQFEKHYGQEAGKYLFEALESSSKIVPMIFAYHRLGPDHRQMAPELETGNDRYTFDDKKIYKGSLKDFYLAATEDREHMYSIADYVDAYLGIEPETPWGVRNVHAGGDSPDIPLRLYWPTARFGPDQAADFFFKAADMSMTAVKKAENAGAEKRVEDFDCAVDDIKAVAHLGRYYANKILGTRDLAFFHRTKDYGRLQSAQEYIEKAIAEWDTLSGITAAHYQPFPDWLRMKTNSFTWKEEGESLSRDITELEREYVEVRKMKPFKGAIPNTGWTPVKEAVAGKDVHIPLFVYSRDGRNITLFYKKCGDDGFKTAKFGPSDRHMVYEAVIPASDVSDPGEYEYFIQLETYMSGDFPDKKIYTRRWFLNWVRFDETGSRIYFPEGAPQRTETLFIHPEKNNISVSDLKTTTEDKLPDIKMVHVKVKATDPAGIAWVTLHYKGLPSFLPWKRKQMVKAGEFYEAAFPIDHEGGIYYIEAANNVGQAVFYPDFLKELPYVIIPSWAVEVAEE